MRSYISIEKVFFSEFAVEKLQEDKYIEITYKKETIIQSNGAPYLISLCSLSVVKPLELYIQNLFGKIFMNIGHYSD